LLGTAGGKDVPFDTVGTSDVVTFEMEGTKDDVPFAIVGTNDESTGGRVGRPPNWGGLEDWGGFVFIAGGRVGRPPS
jgi:hypothetical protein